MTREQLAKRIGRRNARELQRVVSTATLRAVLDGQRVAVRHAIKKVNPWNL